MVGRDSPGAPLRDCEQTHRHMCQPCPEKDVTTKGSEPPNEVLSHTTSYAAKTC